MMASQSEYWRYVLSLSLNEHRSIPVLRRFEKDEPICKSGVERPRNPKRADNVLVKVENWP